MEEWIAQVAPQAPYIVIVGVLILTGFGVPVPEDIPIIVGGYLCGMGYANPWIMFPAIFIAILGADGIVFWLGRRYGHHIPRLPLLRRFLTVDRLARTEAMLHRHGGKFIFMARFLPGIRTAAFFTAGVFKLPYWKFLLYDGAAAFISVPTIFFLAFFFAHEIDRVKHMIAEGQLVAIGVIVVGVALFFGIKRLFRRRLVSV
jgi:membrane protein DedA with SNARE-associated domain